MTGRGKADLGRTTLVIVGGLVILAVAGCLTKPLTPASNTGPPTSPLAASMPPTTKPSPAADGNPTQNRSNVSAPASGGVAVLRYAATVACVVRPTGSSNVFPSCDPNDPAPFNDGDRKPWTARLDLTRDKLAGLGLDTSTQRINLNLSWDANEGVGEWFAFCQTWPDVAAGKACFYPNDRDVQERRLQVNHTLFAPIAIWKEPGVYEAWIEPHPWALQGNNGGPPGEVNAMKHWRFSLEATVFPLGATP